MNNESLDEKSADTMSAEEFFAMMNNDQPSPQTLQSDNLMCCITHESCVNPITLMCGHTFEYAALVTELINRNSINKAGRYAHPTDRTNKNGFKCPYCRTIHTKTLPYFKVNGLKRRLGITSPDTRRMPYPHTCGVLYKSGPKKGTPCNNCAYFHSPDATERYCVKHGPTHCITQCKPVTQCAKKCSGVMIRCKDVPSGMRHVCTSTAVAKELLTHPGVYLCGAHRRSFIKRGSIDVVADQTTSSAPHVNSSCVTKIYTE